MIVGLIASSSELDIEVIEGAEPSPLIRESLISVPDTADASAIFRKGVCLTFYISLSK